MQLCKIFDAQPSPARAAWASNLLITTAHISRRVYFSATYSSQGYPNNTLSKIFYIFCCGTYVNLVHFSAELPQISTISMQSLLACSFFFKCPFFCAANALVLYRPDYLGTIHKFCGTFPASQAKFLQPRRLPGRLADWRAAKEWIPLWLRLLACSVDTSHLSIFRMEG